MLSNFQRITIIRLKKPKTVGLNNTLQWFSSSLGMFGERDKERSCFRVFIELLKFTRQEKWISSEEIAKRANLSRGTVVFHLNKLIESGIVITHKRRYMLRVPNLNLLIQELKDDLAEFFEELEGTAKEVDKELDSTRIENGDINLPEMRA